MGQNTHAVILPPITRHPCPCICEGLAQQVLNYSNQNTFQGWTMKKNGKPIFKSPMKELIITLMLTCMNSLMVIPNRCFIWFEIQSKVKNQVMNSTPLHQNPLDSQCQQLHLSGTNYNVFIHEREKWTHTYLLLNAAFKVQTSGLGQWERASVIGGFERDQWDKRIVSAKNAGAPWLAGSSWWGHKRTRMCTLSGQTHTGFSNAR